MRTDTRPPVPLTAAMLRRRDDIKIRKCKTVTLFWRHRRGIKIPLKRKMTSLRNYSSSQVSKRPTTSGELPIPIGVNVAL